MDLGELVQAYGIGARERQRAAPGASDPAGEVLREMEASVLATAIDGLPERQRYVLVRRYGLGVDEKPATLAELSGELGISKERVRQLQREAERMLRERHYEPAFSEAA